MSLWPPETSLHLSGGLPSLRSNENRQSTVNSILRDSHAHIPVFEDREAEFLTLMKASEDEKVS